MKEQIPRFKSVMIIDDSHIDLYIVSRLITTTNFGKNVLQYSCAMDALNYLKEHQDSITLLPEVIFVDLYMPGITGFEFIALYDTLSTDLKNHCKVFILSSSIDERDVAKSNTDVNIVAMMEKPITREFLKDFKICHQSTV